jgi:hypothetical protein
MDNFISILMDIDRPKRLEDLPVKYVMEKHPAAVRKHLIDIIESKNRRIVRLLRENADIELEIGRMESAIEQRRRELAARRERRAAFERIKHLEDERDREWALRINAEEDARAVRNARLWRATKPLRILFDRCKQVIRSISR